MPKKTSLLAKKVNARKDAKQNDKPESKPDKKTKSGQAKSGGPSSTSKKKSSKKKASPKKTTEKSSKKKASKKKTTPKAKPRKVEHPDIKVRICDNQRPLTREMTRKLLGWAKPPEGVKDGVIKVGKHKVFLTNNQDNRPTNLSWILMLKQEILTRKWKQNGMAFTIGKTGRVLNCQHRLIAHELACQEWEKSPGKWKSFWQTEPTLECIIIYGIEEDDDTVNTMDFVRPRSMADVIYRSECFKDMAKNKRAKCARITEYAIKLLWARTHADELAFGPRRTHSEMFDFINRHPKLLDCVRHIFEENGKNKISKYISPGAAAAMMYLMGSSSTDADPDDGGGYAQQDVPTEETLDWDRWDKANDFWVLLAKMDKKLDPLRTIIGREFEMDPDTGEPYDRWMLTERLALISKAWNLFVKNKAITKSGLELNYVTDDNGWSTLNETPTVGGIDLGD